MIFKKMFRKIFLQYLITYFTYLMVLLVIMIAYYRQNLRYWQDRELEQYETMLGNKIVQFQEQLSNITALGTRLEQDSRYQALSALNTELEPGDYVKVSAIQRDFTSTMLPYQLVSECGIAYPDKLMITRFRSFIGEQGAEEYYNKYFRADHYTKEEWFRFLTSQRDELHSGMKVFSYNYGEKEALIKTVPLGSYGTLYTVINIENLAHFFMPEAIYQDGYFYICDAAGENRVTFQAAEDMDISGFHEIRLYDSNSRLYYALGIPGNYFDALVQPLISALALYLIFLFIGGIGLGLLFSWKNNKPMRSLVLSASSYDNSQLSAESSRNEHDYVAGIMKQLQASVENMNSQLERQREEEKRHLLDMAVQGGGMNTNELLERFHELFPDFTAGCRIVIIIFMEEKLATGNMELSRYLLIQHALKAFYGFDITITSAYTDTILFLLTERAEDCLRQTGRTTLGDLQSFLRDQFNRQTQIAVSDTISDLLEMPSLYVATLYQFRAGIEPVRETMPAFFDFMYHQQFFEALSNGEEEIVISLVKKMKHAIVSVIETFEDRHMGEVVYRSAYLGSLSSLSNILLQVKLNYFDLLSSIYIPTIKNFETIESFFDEILTCCHLFCEKLGEKKRQIGKQRLQQQIMSYLDIHMDDSTLSIQAAAEAFHISDTTMQKIIRHTTGKTFAEYVEGVRVNKALRLLRTTQDSVDSIAVQCGFSSYNSMYKVFKRRYNLSPRAAAETVK